MASNILDLSKSISGSGLTPKEKRKQKQQNAFKKFVTQIKEGCNKQICFNHYCKKNIFSGKLLSFANDTEIFDFSMSTVQQVEDPDELICSQSTTLNRNSLKTESENSLKGLIEDAYSFCCSFYNSKVISNSQEDVEMEYTGSAFDEDGQEEARIKIEKAQALHDMVPETVRQMAHLQIDFKAVRLYFQMLKQSYKDDQTLLRVSISELVELIMFEWSSCENNSQPEKRLMCARGLLMLLQMEWIQDFDWLLVSMEVISALNQVYSPVTSRKVRSEKKLRNHDMLVQYIASFSSEQLHEFVMQLQGVVTANIVVGVVNMPLLEQSVHFLDILHWVNQDLLPQEERIELKEFHNDAVNNNLDLKPSMADWAKYTKIQVRNHQNITHGNLFNLCSYHWILNPHSKSIMLQKYNKIEWQNTQHASLLRAAWDPDFKKNIKAAHNYIMVVNRTNVLGDSLEKIVKIKSQNGLDPLKLPLKTEFENEPGIDMGGVMKEYFSLIMKELFNPQYGMFKFNEDVQLYWFNGSTFEPNINFELVGTLMGLAIYNNMFLDMPMAHACYKILLDQEPDLNDLQQWQPETAKSLKFILDYNDHHKASLEDIVCRNFTVDVEKFGAVQEVELKEGGANIAVNRFNREEFVKLYINFQFKEQCAEQLAYFKKGFERMVDKEALKSLLDSAELESLICGQRTLNFAELKDTVIYGNGYTPDCIMMKWFWEIVLTEWDDEKRRRLLTFTTGSDRAPVNGLKSMKFFIIKEGEDDNKLPSSHTCFNQLCLPSYSRQEILRDKLQTAIDNSTGFGMV